MTYPPSNWPAPKNGRKGSTNLSPSEAYDLDYLAGKSVVFTGPTTGLGHATMMTIGDLPEAKRPSKVILVGRSQEKLTSISDFFKKSNISTSIYVGDLQKPKDIFRICREIKAAEATIDIMGLNAGAWLTYKKREFQEDGFEKMYVVNFLQMAIFIEELCPIMESTAASSGSVGRICVMGSFTTMSLAKGDLSFEQLRKDGKCVLMQGGGFPYSQTKLAQHVYCKHLATSVLNKTKVTVNVACPGSAPSNTPGWMDMKRKMKWIWPLLLKMVGARPLDEGAATILHAMGAKAMEGETGKFVDWGYKHRYHRITKADDLDFYPSEGKGKSGRGKEAPTTSSATLCKKLYDETKTLMDELRTKYA